MSKQRLPEMMCRWNAFEQPARDVLRAYKEGTMQAETALIALDAFIAAATRRGNELDQEDANFETCCWDNYEDRLRKMYPNDRRFNNDNGR